MNRYSAAHPSSISVFVRRVAFIAVQNSWPKVDSTIQLIGKLALCRTTCVWCAYSMVKPFRTPGEHVDLRSRTVM